MLCYGGADDDRLSKKARQVIDDEANEIFASAWERFGDPAFAGFGSKTLW